MFSDPIEELRRLRDSAAFRTYEDVRRMHLCHSAMESKLDELRRAVSTARSLSRYQPSYDADEARTIHICQLLADFLSRMYSCKNLAAVCAKRHGFDREFRELKHRVLGYEVSVMVCLRNYVVHVDMLPVEQDAASGLMVFTRRCRSDDMWNVSQKRYLGGTDLESLLAGYSVSVSSFYREYFTLLMSSADTELWTCRKEIREVNRRLGFEIVRYDPKACEVPPIACAHVIETNLNDKRIPSFEQHVL